MLSKIEKAVVDAALERLFSREPVGLAGLWTPMTTDTAGGKEVTLDIIANKAKQLEETVAATTKPYRPSGPEWSAKMPRVMKKWHADRKANGAKPQAKPKTKRRLSPEGKAAIIAGTKAYWKRKRAAKKRAGGAR